MNNDDLVIENARAVIKAITDEGSHPEYHNQIVEKHRREWPYLWEKIDKLIMSFGEFV